MMADKIVSRFSITSERFSSELLSIYFPWKVVERDKFAGQTKPKEKTDFHFTAYDLGFGSNNSLRVHLEKATDELMKYLQKLEDLQWECNYTLWIKYSFPDGVGSAEIPATLSSRLAHLRVSLMIEMGGIRIRTATSCEASQNLSGEPDRSAALLSPRD